MTWKVCLFRRNRQARRFWQNRHTAVMLNMSLNTRECSIVRLGQWRVAWGLWVLWGLWAGKTEYYRGAVYVVQYSPLADCRKAKHENYEKNGIRQECPRWGAAGSKMVVKLKTVVLNRSPESRSAGKLKIENWKLKMKKQNCDSLKQVSRVSECSKKYGCPKSGCFT